MDDFDLKKPLALLTDGSGKRQPPPSIAKIFSLIESNKQELNIETYSLSQTSLEQVFLSFARKQFNPSEFNMMSNPILVNNGSVGVSVGQSNSGIRSTIKREPQVNYNTNLAFDESETHTIVHDLRV